MTFILSNITNWLTDSQSSESSSRATDAGNSEHSEEWACENDQSYCKIETRGNRAQGEAGDPQFSDGNDSPAEDDLPGISQVVSSAFEWGGYLLNVGKETGKHVTRTAVKHFKSAFQENVCTEETSQAKMPSDEAVAPWVGHVEEKMMKAQILLISEDKRNFMRGPPAGVQFPFDYTANHPVAMIMLDEDPNLKLMRFELVPKQVKEETFWRNYFYHVALAKQSEQLATMAKQRVSVAIDETDRLSAPSADNELVFVANAFPACDVIVETDRYSDEASKENDDDDLQNDFEMVEMADCDCRN